MVQAFGQWFLESGNQMLFLALILAFSMGVAAGLWFKHRHDPMDGKKTLQGDEAFLKGVQYMLSNDPDHAIEAFTKSVRVNSNTIETYVALGNLFRSRGDIDRAIRIRQTIILRPNIAEDIKLRALFDLGLDYKKGGFLNRALRTFHQVLEKTPSHVETLKLMERIYEELRDWQNAFATRQKISKLTKENDGNILAHHLVEAGKSCLKNDDPNRAISHFHKAIATHKACVDAYLQLGDLYFERKNPMKAVSVWKEIVKVSPSFSFLAYDRLVKAYADVRDFKPVGDFLKEHAKSSGDVFTLMAVARYLYSDEDLGGALLQIDRALEFDPNFWEARKLKGMILIKEGRELDALNDYQDLITNMDFPCLRFQCAQCGFQPGNLLWQCPQCKGWDTIQLSDLWMNKRVSEKALEGVFPKLAENLNGD